MLAAQREGALLVLTGGVRRGRLAVIAQQEDATGDLDPEPWAAVGGRLEHYSLRDPVYWQQHDREAAERREDEKGMTLSPAWLGAMEALSDRYGLSKWGR